MLLSSKSDKKFVNSERISLDRNYHGANGGPNQN